jgi:hypothetical protein
MVSLTAENFAATAQVAVYFGDAPCALITASSDGAGAIQTLKFPIPSFAKAGIYTIRVVDNLSRYPVTTTFRVAP